MIIFIIFSQGIEDIKYKKYKPKFSVLVELLEECYINVNVSKQYAYNKGRYAPEVIIRVYQGRTDLHNGVNVFNLIVYLIYIWIGINNSFNTHIQLNI